jgi:GSCFA family
MSIFRTTIAPSPAPFQINHKTRILMAGSCFTTHIGQYLRTRKFEVMTNPMGVIYNPVSLAQSILPDQDFTADQFFQNEGLWRHWNLHSDLAYPDLDTAVDQAQKTADSTRNYLQTTDVLILTLGTAHVFYRLDRDEIVANCHKMPAKLFDQRRLSVAETVTTISNLIQQVRAIQPNLQIILTVSPVRHWRNGAVEHQRSKSVLLLACADLCEQLPNTLYFPAYECLMDDLRDYRFYAADMLHPSETAIEYIWQHFEATFLSTPTQQLCKQIEKIVAAAAHRPFNPHTAAHQTFQQKQLDAIAVMEATYPEIRFEEERRLFIQS